jgi:hypothetical protein
VATDLVREGERCEEEVKRLDVQVKQRTWDLQTLVMKTQPTPSFSAMPAFPEKLLLLKELVIQILELKMENAARSERTIVLKAASKEMRKRLGGWVGRE